MIAKRYNKTKKTVTKLTLRLLSYRLVWITLMVMLLALLAPIVLFIIFRPRPIENISYGVNFSDKYATQLGLDWQNTYIKILDDLGAKNLRLVAYWDDIERQNDVYDYSNIKWQLDRAEERDLSVILIIGRKTVRYPECFQPEWWSELPSEKLQELELMEYLKNTVVELKDYNSIKKWQVENEPFFPFGVCENRPTYELVKREVDLVKQLDPDRPIVVQDSGEGGLWYWTYSLGDYLSISMYRKIWYDFWGAFGGEFIYFKYPLAHWSYAVKAGITQVPIQRIIVTELQAEPWGPRINSEITQQQKDTTMSRKDFIDTINYAQKSGIRDLYFWGVEWWLWEKEVNGNSYFWDTAKPLFN